MEGVITEGTGKRIVYNPLYRIAGKSGTAQVADANKGYKARRQYQASFAGYFPADKPKYSLIVVVNDPKNGYYGAEVAGPVFKEIADKVYSSDLEMHQNLPTHYVGNTQLPQVKTGNMRALQQVYHKLGVKPLYAANSPRSADTSNGIAPQEIKYRKGTVPTVTGMTLSDALYVMGNAGYKTAVRGSGMVARQSVTGGSLIPKGAKITLELQ